MPTDAQKRAHQAHINRLKDAGWVRASFWLSPRAQKKIAAVRKSRGISRQKAVEIAFNNLEP